MRSTKSFRALAGTVVLGCAVATTQFVGVGVASAADCGPYPASVVTTTSASLSHYIAQFGTKTIVKAKVKSSLSNDTPTGSVKFTVAGLTQTVSLSGGAAAAVLPRRLPAQHTYSVKASYIPTACSHWLSSKSSVKHYTVVRAFTRTHAKAIRVRGHALVIVSVSARTGLTPYGWVTVRLYAGHQFKGSKIVRLHGGSATATLGRVNHRGGWKAKVSYHRNHNYHGSSKWVRIRSFG